MLKRVSFWRRGKTIFTRHRTLVNVRNVIRNACTCEKLNSIWKGGVLFRDRRTIYVFTYVSEIRKKKKKKMERSDFPGEQAIVQRFHVWREHCGKFCKPAPCHLVSSSVSLSEIYLIRRGPNGKKDVNSEPFFPGTFHATVIRRVEIFIRDFLLIHSN